MFMIIVVITVFERNFTQKKLIYLKIISKYERKKQ